MYNIQCFSAMSKIKKKIHYLCLCSIFFKKKVLLLQSKSVIVQNNHFFRVF